MPAPAPLAGDAAASPRDPITPAERAALARAERRRIQAQRAAEAGTGPDAIPGLPPSGAALEADQAEIRRVLDVYRRAVEAQDLAAAQAVRPAATLDELQRGLAAAGPRGLNGVRMEILAVTATDAVVRLNRPAPPPVGVRVQVVRLKRRGGSWIISDPGR